MVSRKEWRKVLYLKQDFSDNYVDAQFLLDHRNNSQPRLYDVSFFMAFIGSICVNQQLCSAIIFLLAYFVLQNNIVTSCLIILIMFILSVLSCIIYSFENKQIFSKFFSNLTSALICTSYGFGISPVLKTLTDTISTDTIYAMVAISLFIHLLFHNYGLVSSMVSNEVSINAAIFSSVCLSSRLQLHLDVFCLLTIGLILFTLFPVIRNHLLNFGCFKTLVTITGVQNFFIYIILCSIHPTCSFVFLLLIIIINGIFPYWFVSWQRFKW